MEFERTAMRMSSLIAGILLVAFGLLLLPRPSRVWAASLRDASTRRQGLRGRTGDR